MSRKSYANPVKAVIVGAGHRSMLYASYSMQHVDELKITGVVDPDKIRRDNAAKIFELPENSCFESVQEFVNGTKTADVIINGTMDSIHVSTTIPLLQKGYDVLLEKPIGTTKEEVLELHSTAKECGKRVMICHVLRYAPFYMKIRERIINGEVGDIISISTQENVSYHHMAVGYVRGKWNSRNKCGSTMLMAKSCHDLDLITWMKSGIRPQRVSSFGSLMYFRPDKAPEGAGTRCLTDCKIEKTCPYSAYKNYIEQGLWDFYAWDSIEHLGPNPSIEEKIDSLKTGNPFGRCVWKCDNDVVDHQVVNIEFEDGCTATHSMTGNSSKPCRYIHIIGTKGEIEGVMEDGAFYVRKPDARKGHAYTEEKISVDSSNDMHGGGDLLLVGDFISAVRGEKASISATTLDDSIYGHLIGFAADKANTERRILEINRI